MNYINLIIGLIFIIFGIIYFSYIFKNEKKLKNDGMIQSFRVKKRISMLGLILVGIYMVYKELQKILWEA